MNVGTSFKASGSTSQTADLVKLTGQSSKDDYGFSKLLADRLPSANRTQSTTSADRKQTMKDAETKTETPKNPTDESGEDDLNLKQDGADEMQQLIAQLAAGMMNPGEEQSLQAMQLLAAMTNSNPTAETGVIQKTDLTEQTSGMAALESALSTEGQISEALTGGAENLITDSRTELPQDKSPVESDFLAAVGKKTSSADQKTEVSQTAQNDSEKQIAGMSAKEQEATAQETKVKPFQTTAAEKKEETTVHTEVNQAAFSAENRGLDTVQIQIPEGSQNPQEVLVQQLQEAVKQKTAEGVQEFQVSVNPKNLGDIHMKIELAQGEVRISITCQEEKTMNLLTQHADDIARIVEQNMSNLTAQNTSGQTDYLQQQSNQEQNQQEQQQQRQNQQKQDAPEDFLQMLRLGIVTQ